MVDKKITELPSVTGANLAVTDVFPVVDVSANTTSKVTRAEFFKNVPAIEVTGDVTFGDNDKAIFGAGSDLQIYHDGSNSYIEDGGAGNLYVKSNVFRVYNAAGDEISANFVQNGAVSLYYDNAAKLATTSTGVDVTGTITSDKGVFGDATTEYNTFTITGGHVGDGGNDYGLTVYSFEPAITLIDRSTGAGSSQLFGTSGGGMWLVGDTLNDGTIGHSTNTTDFVLAKFEPNLTGLFTGNTERMRIDSSGNVGIGTASPASLVGGTDTSPVLSIGGTDSALVTGDKAGSLSFITNDTSYTATYANGVTSEIASISESATGAAYGLALYTGTTTGSNRAERLRISATGNVGIGTSSPTYALDVQDTGDTVLRVKANSSGTGNDDDVTLILDCTETGEAVLEFRQDGVAKAAIEWFSAGSPDFNIRTEAGTDGAIDFQPNNSLAMRIDASGNVGIGNTSPASKLDVTGTVTATAFSGPLTGGVTGNASTATALQTARTISLAGDVSGSVSFDGSANVSITATVADDSHNHIISNVDGLQTALDAKAPIASPTFTGTVTLPNIAITGTTDVSLISTGNPIQIGASSGINMVIDNNEVQSRNNGAGNTLVINGSGGNVSIATGGGNVTLGSAATTTTAAGTVEAATFNATSTASGGFQGISADSAAAPSFTWSGDLDTGIYRAGTNIIGFTTAGAEKMRITSAGEVQVAGTTDRGAYNIQCNGTGVWGAGAYTNGSDARIKEGISEITSGLDVVSKLRAVSFRYKEDFCKDNALQPGFIAQELQVAMEGKDYLSGVVKESGEYLSVAYQSLIPILTKAIQEQQEIISALEARVTALGG